MGTCPTRGTLGRAEASKIVEMKTMRQRVRARSRWVLLWGCLVFLAALAALLVPAPSPAQPPAEAGKALPPDAPLFRNDARPEAVSLAALATGAGFATGSGPWCCLVAVRAGAHPLFDAWDLNGPLTTRPGRILLGAETLFLGGFAPAPGWPTGLGQLAVLQAGDDLHCWTLIDTDQFRPLPPWILERGRIRDGTDLAEGALEIPAYEEIVTQAYYTAPLAFRKAARRDLTYAQIFADPATYRGQPVHIEGLLRMLSREKPSLECRANGVSNLYEAWILNEGTREFFCFLSVELPPALKPYLGEEGKKKIKQTDLRVSADGYFYKKFRYKAIDSKGNTARDAPVFIGHSLDCTPGDERTESDEWGHSIMAMFIGIVGFAVAVIVGLTWWFRHNDRRVRGRVMAARDAGFVPPDEASRAEEVSRERERPEASAADRTAPVAAPPAQRDPHLSGSPESLDPKFGGRLGDFSGPAR
jgi:hypothetical protein